MAARVRSVALATMLAVAVLAGREGRAWATDTVVAPGESLTLTADIVLVGTDTLTAGGAGDRCQIDGQTHAITTMMGWTGSITIIGCDLVNLGSAAQPGLEVDADMGAIFDVESSTFGTSGQISITAYKDLDFRFIGNTLADTSVVTIDKMSLPNSRPSFMFTGSGGATLKLFQGNRVLRSWVSILSGNNFLIGGNTPAEGNVVVGVRAGFDIGGTNMVLRGNYVHTNGELAGWNQVAALYAVGADDTSMLVEHNVLRGGNWLVRGFSGGELRYNILGDAYANFYVQVGPDNHAKIHRNIWLRNNKLMEQTAVAGFAVVEPVKNGALSLEVYNNTLDGSGACYDYFGRPVLVNGAAFLQSLRSNVIFNFPSNVGMNTAIVGPGQDENFQPVLKGDPGPPLLGYADYNLFNNPAAAQIDNYGISVAGLTERASDGFAAHDATAGGAKDEQVDPMFTGPLPVVFPFSDDDVISGAVNVCQILAFYRQIYTPAAGSPLIDKGDPADGDGVDIGAVGAGAPDANDQFGTLCAEADRQLATPPTVVTVCPTPIGSTGTGGTSMIPAPPGFMCVCDAGSGAPPVLSLTWLAALVVPPLLIRRGRRAAARARRAPRSSAGRPVSSASRR